MQNHDLFFPEEFYIEKLLIVDGVRFTQRELDIIACVLNGKGAKNIACFFTHNGRSLSVKSVETHVLNIRRKIGGNSKDSIINFFEKANKNKELHAYYLCLMMKKDFEQCAYKISELVKPTGKNISIYIDQEFVELDESKRNSRNNVILDRLQQCLNHFFSEVFIEKYSSKLILKPSEAESFNIYFLEKLNVDFSDGVALKKIDPNKTLLVFLSDANVTEPHIPYIQVKEQQNYYFLFLEILNKLFPKNDLDSVFSEFNTKYKNIDLGIADNISQTTNSLIPYKENKIGEKNRSFSHQFILKAVLGFFIVLSFLSIYFLYKNREVIQSGSHQTRADLFLPVDSAFLKRNDIINEINAKYVMYDGIVTIALVGTGGAGKTTIARQYALSQKSDVIWEINARSRESILESFENLALSLARTDIDQQKLLEIKRIQDKKEREENIFNFVKGLLLQNPDWFLIFDNVENFTEIQKYFPRDPKSWGEGRIIITTIDSNILNNKYINFTILVGQLTPEEKLRLYKKITDVGDPQVDNLKNIEKIKKFLEDIPPYPLDITIAAYYLKLTNTSFEKYLEYIEKDSNTFDKVQSEILEETGDYAKTRYSIITRSLESLIDTNKEFGDLLLFTCFLDSQNIPRGVLDEYKNSAIVDDFIINLKKYSLITKETNTQVGSAISLHGSMQSLALTYLTKKFNLEKDKKELDKIVSVFGRYIYKVAEQEEKPILKVILPHCEFFISKSELLSESAKNNLKISLGSLQCLLIQYDTAQKLLMEALKTHKSINGDYEPVIQGLIYLGVINLSLGNLEEAKNYLRQSLDLCYKHLPETDLHIPKALIYLGRVEMNLGRSYEAKKFYEQGYHLYTKYHGENWVKIAWSKRSLGDFYREIGDYVKSQKFLEESVNLYETDCQARKSLSWSLTILACLYRDIGEYDKSKKLLEKAIGLSKEYLGEKEGWMFAQLGSTLRKLGNYKDAKTIIEQSFNLDEKYYSGGNIKRIISYYANLYRDIGFYEEALELHKKSLAMHIDSFGEDNIRAATLYFNIGYDYLELLEYQKAMKFLEHSYKTFVKFYGADHIKTLKLRFLMGVSYMRIGNYKKAHELLDKNILIQQEFFGKDHIESAKVLTILGELNLLENNLQEAEKAFNDAEIIFLKTGHNDVCMLYEQMANLHLKNSENNKARMYLTKAQNIVIQNFPEYQDSEIYLRIRKKLEDFNK